MLHLTSDSAHALPSLLVALICGRGHSVLAGQQPQGAFDKL